MRRLPLALSLLLLLAACTSTPPPPAVPAADPPWPQRQSQLSRLTTWQVQGRVNARYYDEAHTPRIRWQQRGTDYTIRLWGTLNAGATLIEGQPGQVRFEQGNTVRTAARPEDLILEQLGYELPVSELNDWIKGLPVVDAPHQLQLGDRNEVVRLQQAGWTLDYLDHREVGSWLLPRRVRMVRDDEPISLEFIGLTWTLADPS